MKPQKARILRSAKNVTRSRKIKNLLVVIGVVIAFGTFVVKDAMRERLKDLSDSISKAEQVYSSHESVDLISLQLIRMETEIVLYRSDSKPNQVVAAAKAMANEVDSMVPASFAAVKEVLDKLPGREAFDGAAESIKKKIDDAHEEMQKSLKELNDSKNPDAVFIVLRAAQSELVEIRIALLADAVLDRAKQVRGAAEKQYATCTWVSYFLLYPLGLVTGLIGRFYDIDSAGTEG